MKLIETVTTFDGCKFKIKYSYPNDITFEKLVIYVNGSGPSTYDNKRKGIDETSYNYHDFFADEFNKRNVAYCSYNTRGVDIGETEPLFIDLNDEKYQGYLPLNSVKDVEAIIIHLKNKSIFENVKIYLLGWSEGTIIAPLVALNSVAVDALLLAGYVNENMKHTMTWQLSGNSNYINLQKFFDPDKKGYITKEDLEADKFNIKAQLIGDISFEYLDTNNDGKIDIGDFATLQLPYLQSIFNAIDNGDDEWLKNNYNGGIKGFVLKSAWFKQHFSLKPNKEVLPLLDLPIYIFHGVIDANCPVRYAEDIKNSFDELGKSNLTVNIFEDHNHDLNFGFWLVKKEMPKGIACIFDTVDKL